MRGRPRSNYYIDDDELYYEIILSKGKGFLTPKALAMFMLVGENFMLKKKHSYWLDSSMKEDCHQQGMMQLLLNWRGFNEKKYDKALPWVTEVFKRGMTHGFNQVIALRRGCIGIEGNEILGGMCWE